MYKCESVSPWVFGIVRNKLTLCKVFLSLKNPEHTHQTHTRLASTGREGVRAVNLKLVHELGVCVCLVFAAGGKHILSKKYLDMNFIFSRWRARSSVGIYKR
jgi:hypothetical protein